MPDSISRRYEQGIAEGHLERDAAQSAVVARLDALATHLAGYRPARKSGALGWLFGNSAEPPQGLYVWGSVGRGKTMLMDLFFAAAPVPRKRRVHFHAFMADVHGRIHAWRQQAKRGAVRGDDPIAPVADALADEAWLLCFDEFSVTDIADAMILGRLFQGLFARGVVVVATSNVEPSNLYSSGLNRALFLPFISLIQQRMDVVNLVARTDFRLEKLGGAPVYHVPADAAASAAMTAAFKSLTGHATGLPTEIQLLGRAIKVPQARLNVARFGFADLCDAPLGAQDFLAIARAFHTVFVDDIPVIAAAKANAAKRFIILIDALYDRHVKLIASAAAEPIGLFLGTEGREAFEFERTASRLIEMRSDEYLALPHGAAASSGSGASTGLVET